jgi:hypothetical protein
VSVSFDFIDSYAPAQNGARRYNFELGATYVGYIDENYAYFDNTVPGFSGKAIYVQVIPSDRAAHVGDLEA